MRGENTRRKASENAVTTDIAPNWLVVKEAKRVTEEDVTYRMESGFRGKIDHGTGHVVSILAMPYCKHLEMGLAGHMGLCDVELKPSEMTWNAHAKQSSLFPHLKSPISNKTPGTRQSVIDISPNALKMFLVMSDVRESPQRIHGP